MSKRYNEKRSKMAAEAVERELNQGYGKEDFETNAAKDIRGAAMGEGDEELFEKKLSKEEKKALAKAKREAKKKKKDKDDGDIAKNMSEQPFTRWSELALNMPGRHGKQIRERWINHLNPNISHLPFTEEDDLKLWEAAEKYGKKWVEISTKYFHSTRAENQIKNRWYSAAFKKYISDKFGPEAYK
jgi:Myb-like DNA-binding domain